MVGWQSARTKNAAREANKPSREGLRQKPSRDPLAPTVSKSMVGWQSERSLFPNHEPSMPQAESQAAGPSGPPQTPPQPEHKKKKFKPSPSPEGLHGYPHHPARDGMGGMRSSFSLPAFSPAK